MRLGYACLTLGMPEPAMRSAQLGRFRRGLVDLAPIYAHNVEYAERSIAYAARHGLAAFRISSDVLPLIDQDPSLKKLVPSLARLRCVVREAGVHVSNHPAQYVVLTSPDEAVLANSRQVLVDNAWLMNEIHATGSITIHGGGVYGDREVAGRRLEQSVRALPALVRRYLVLENDERAWTVPELLATGTGLPIVFDKLHWQANPRSAPYEVELEGAIATWPQDRLPEFHYSEQAEGKARGAHSDYVTGRGLLRFFEELHEVLGERDAVVILEAKRKELAIALAIGELGKRDKARLVELVPDLARAPKDWLTRAREVDARGAAASAAD